MTRGYQRTRDAQLWRDRRLQLGDEWIPEDEGCLAVEGPETAAGRREDTSGRGMPSCGGTGDCSWVKWDRWERRNGGRDGGGRAEGRWRGRERQGAGGREVETEDA